MSADLLCHDESGGVVRVAAEENSHVHIDGLERLGTNVLAGLCAQRDEVPVGVVPVHGECAVGWVEQPVERHARGVAPAQLRHRVEGAVRLADDFADPVGASVNWALIAFEA